MHYGLYVIRHPRQYHAYGQRRDYERHEPAKNLEGIAS